MNDKDLRIDNATRADLLSLPVRKWDDDKKRYDSLLIISNGKKHDSGWGEMVIIGCVDEKPIEIAASGLDDINWHLQYNPRTDCALPSRAMRFWYRGEGKYRVGCALSSTDVYLED